ncbi:MAG: glycosyltransferase [Acidobacteriota bacterium]
MHVLALAPVFPHAESPSEGLFNAQHAEALVAAGIRVTVVVTKPWLPAWLARRTTSYRPLAHLPRRERRGALDIFYARYLHVPRYRLPRWTVTSCARAILRCLRRELPGVSFDVVHAHSVWPTGLAAPVVAEATGRPCTVTLHIRDDEQLYGARQGAALFDTMLLRARALVAVGRPLERYLADLGARADKVRRIANGAELGEARRAVEAASEACLDPPWGRLVSVANLWPLKGIDFNLRALARLDQMGCPWHSYTVVGDGPERASLEALARELGLADRVIFMGSLPHGEALRQVGRADIFTLPSWQEAFGVAYVEAMACGKPVIGCRTQGAEDIIRHERDGLLVHPRDPESLSEALARLLQAPDYARKLGAAGIRRAAEFTWERNAKRYLDLYREILDPPTSVPATG